MFLLSLLIFLVINPGNDALPIQDRAPSLAAVAPTRSTFDVVWICITTTFLCGWACIHLDLYIVKGANDSMTRLKYNLFFLAIAIISPEIIVGWAIMQRLNAAEILREYEGWTMTHAHVLDMGGFALYFPETTRKRPRDCGEVDKEQKVEKNKGTLIDEDFIQPRFIEILNFERFKTLLDEGSIEFPTITKDEIDDRSKTDGLTKFLAGVQTCRFILQCIVRKTQSLAITELEVTTLALATLNLITLLLWRSKPQNMRVPIPVYLVEGSREWDNWKEIPTGEGAEQNPTEECRTMVIDSRNQRTRKEAFLKTQQRKLDEAKKHSNMLLKLLDRLLRILESIFLDGSRSLVKWYITPETVRKGKKGHLLKVARRVVDLVVAVSTLPAIRSPSGGDNPRTLLDRELKQHLGEWKAIPCKDVFPRHFYQFLLDLPDFVLIPSSFLRHKWVQSKSKRGVPMVFLRAFLCVCVIISLPLVVAYFAMNVLIVLVTPFSFLFLQSTRLCTLADFYVVSSVSVSDPNKARIHRRSMNIGLEEAHLTNGLIIGSLFGALHCLGWNFPYATLSEQLAWRSAALALTIIPSLFYFVSMPIADPRPMTPFVCIVYLNRLTLLFILYTVARVTIIVLAVKLLWEQPESAYLAVNWTQLIPHVA